jgi:hypothetical protein
MTNTLSISAALLPKLLSGEMRVRAAKLKEDYVGC